MREFTADLFISLDGFASGVDQPPYFGYLGLDLEKWVHAHLDQPQIIVMVRSNAAPKPRDARLVMSQPCVSRIWFLAGRSDQGPDGGTMAKNAGQRPVSVLARGSIRVCTAKSTV